MRYRAEYLHRPTSSRILFTVPLPVDVDPASSAAQAIARRAATAWIEQSGLAECIFLSIVQVTDKMSVGGSHAP